LQDLSKKEPDLQAVETDNFFYLAACGTYVAGSCQSVDGNPSLNKCLLAYLLDGKNRLLALVNPQGVIQARAILRLLIDAETKKPVLFIERIYPSIARPELREALIALAKQKAKDLNLPLLHSEEGAADQILYPHPVASLGGPSPYEYVDALREIQKGSKFQIPRVYQYPLTT
jgi:hypothetical protein